MDAVSHPIHSSTRLLRFSFIVRTACIAAKRLERILELDREEESQRLEVSERCCFFFFGFYDIVVCWRIPSRLGWL